MSAQNMLALQISEIGKLDLDSPHDQLTLRAAIALDALGR